MASTAIRLGINAKLYRNTGSYASPTWNEIDNCRDLSWDPNPTWTSAQIRAHGIHKLGAVTAMELTISFEVNWDTADDDWGVLNDAFTGSIDPTANAKEFLCIDRATGTGAEGWRAVMAVSKFAKTENNEGIQVNQVELKPAIYASGYAAPAWYVGA